MVTTGKFLTDPDCIAQMKYVNAPAWIAAGYTGKDQVVFLDDKASDAGHIATSRDILASYLPDIKVLSGRINLNSKSGVITSVTVTCNETAETIPFDDFMQKHNVTLINNSTDGGDGTKILPQAVWMKDKIKQYNLIVSGAAGNGNGQPTTQRFNGACVVVTQCVLKNGVPAFANKAVGPNIDFAMFAGYQSGTSHAAPSWLALAGYLRCKNPDITQEEAYEYLKNHCVDIGATGKDERFGWGVPVMGDPGEVISTEVTQTQIKVDGQIKTVNRILYNGENYIRLRDFEDVLGVVNVEYDAVAKMPTVED